MDYSILRETSPTWYGIGLSTNQTTLERKITFMTMSSPFWTTFIDSLQTYLNILE